MIYYYYYNINSKWPHIILITMIKLKSDPLILLYFYTFILYLEGDYYPDP